MKKMKMKKVMALLLAMIMVFAVPLSASAAEVQNAADNPSTSLSAPAIEPRGINTTVTKNLTTSYQLILQDSNWWGDRTVEVNFTSSKGPQSVSVYVLDSNGNSLGTRTLQLAGSTTFRLPSGGGSFSVYAKRVSGVNGSASIQVILSK